MVEDSQTSISLEHRITRLEAYIDNHKLDERVETLEHWKFIVLGAAIFIGFLVTLFADEIKGLLFQ